jgi:hypothetical protein
MEKKSWNVAPAGLTCLLLVVALAVAACGGDSTGGAAESVGPVPLAAAITSDLDQFSEWSEPVNLGAPVNTTFSEAGAFISKDGLSLYFNSPRPGGLGGIDIYVSRRANVDDPWGPAQNLGETVNSSSNEQTATVSLDGHRLYFASDRPGGFGGLDLYVSRRPDPRDDFGWGSPQNLGAEVNTEIPEMAPAPFEDEETGTITLYFSRDAVGARDIWASTLASDESFGPALPVGELNTLFDDARPAIRRDGLEIFFDSNRPGSVGLLDIWVSTRASTSVPWSTPVNVGPVFNSAALDARPALSFDGTTLYFHSGRPGNLGPFDIYVATRTKL